MGRGVKLKFHLLDFKSIAISDMKRQRVFDKCFLVHETKHEDFLYSVLNLATLNKTHQMVNHDDSSLEKAGL